MEIILRETIDSLGRAGEVVKVADGYARNYLLPRKLAYPATPGNLKVIELNVSHCSGKKPSKRETLKNCSSCWKGWRFPSAGKLESRTRCMDR